MKTSKSMLLMILAAAALGIAQARADEVPEIRSYFEQVVSNDPATSEGSCRQASDTNDDFYFRNFWLRIRGELGFSIAGLVTVTVVPETELLFQRELPDGWSVYKP